MIEEDRFTQAIRLLGDAVAAARSGLPADHARLLDVRHHLAAALVLGGEQRQARDAFMALATDYTRISGPDSADARECRLQIAYCDAELGETDAALAGFRGLLADLVRRDGHDRSQEALELREQIGDLLLAAQRRTEAVRWLRPLRDDLLAAGRMDGSPGRTGWTSCSPG